jgi:hypothetical protein
MELILSKKKHCLIVYIPVILFEINALNFMSTDQFIFCIEILFWNLSFFTYLSHFRRRQIECYAWQICLFLIILRWKSNKILIISYWNDKIWFYSLILLIFLFCGLEIIEMFIGDNATKTPSCSTKSSWQSCFWLDWSNYCYFNNKIKSLLI